MRQRRWLLRAVWLIMLGCVITGSLLPDSSAPKRALDDLEVSDKLWHVVAYGILVLLPALHETPLMTWLLAVGAASLGVALEFGQNLTASRSFELGDILANGAGVLCGLAAAKLIRPRLTGARDWSPVLLPVKLDSEES